MGAKRGVTGVLGAVTLLASGVMLSKSDHARATVLPLDCSMPQPQTRACARRFELLQDGAIDVPTNARFVIHAASFCSYPLTPEDLHPELRVAGGEAVASDWPVRFEPESHIGLFDSRHPGFGRVGASLEPNTEYAVVDGWGLLCHWTDPDQCVSGDAPSCEGLTDGCCDVATSAPRELLRFRTAAGPDLEPPAAVPLAVACTRYASDPTAEWLSMGATFELDEESDVVEVQLMVRRDDEPPFDGPARRAFRANGQRRFEHVDAAHPLAWAMDKVILPEGSSRRDDPAYDEAPRVEEVSGRWHYATRAVDWAGNVGPVGPELTLTIPNDCEAYAPGSAPTMTPTATDPDASSTTPPPELLAGAAAPAPEADTPPGRDGASGAGCRVARQAPASDLAPIAGALILLGRRRRRHGRR